MRRSLKRFLHAHRKIERKKRRASLITFIAKEIRKELIKFLPGWAWGFENKDVLEISKTVFIPRAIDHIECSIDLRESSNEQ